MKALVFSAFTIWILAFIWNSSFGCVYDNRLSVPTDEARCSEIAGSCVDSSGCSDGKFVAYHCPGADVCCVPTNISDCDRHLMASEGNMYLDGYIPTSGSGVTIASGVDIGQRLPHEYEGLDRTIFEKLKPYMAIAHGRPRNKDDVCNNSTLNATRLNITFEEGLELDNFFKNISSSKNTEYTANLGLGKCVIRSLNHYCGDVMVSQKDYKCNFPDCPSYLRDALIGGNATDRILLNALIDHHNCISMRGIYKHIAERFSKEICYISCIRW